MSLSMRSSASPSRSALALAIFVQGLSLVSAHPHHGNGDPDAPMDTILWMHIIVQLVVWGGIFGVGMVLGIAR